MKRRYRWDYKTAKLVEIAPDAQAPQAQSHYVIKDETEPFVSQADGRVYTSKSSYRKELKARGLIEVGNEKGYLQSATKAPNVPTREYVDTIKRSAREIGLDWI